MDDLGGNIQKGKSAQEKVLGRGSVWFLPDSPKYKKGKKITQSDLQDLVMGASHHKGLFSFPAESAS